MFRTTFFCYSFTYYSYFSSYLAFCTVLLMSAIQRIGNTSVWSEISLLTDLQENGLSYAQVPRMLAIYSACASARLCERCIVPIDVPCVLHLYVHVWVRHSRLFLHLGILKLHCGPWLQGHFLGLHHQLYRVCLRVSFLSLRAFFCLPRMQHAFGFPSHWGQVWHTLLIFLGENSG